MDAPVSGPALVPPSEERCLVSAETVRVQIVYAPETPVAQWPVTVLEPASGWQWLDCRELWRYRELLYFLAWRDVKVRYKQTVLGAAWAVLQPALLMVVFTACLSGPAGLGPADYALQVYLGIVPWTFVAAAITHAAGSIISNERLVTKVYFPRLAIPFAAAGVALVDFSIALAMQAVLMAWNGGIPSWQWLLLPAIWAAMLATALGVGTLLAALTAQYRDFRHALPFLTQFWMFATPTIYLPGQTQAWWQICNPLTGLIAAHRAASLGLALPWDELMVSALWMLLLLPGGCLYFRRVEEQFPDLV